MSQRILFITDSDKRFSGGIKQLYYNILGLQGRGYQVFLAARPEAGIVALARPLLSGSQELAFKWPYADGRRVAAFCREHGIGRVHAFHTPGAMVGAWGHWHNRGIRLFLNRGVSFPPPPFFYYPGIAGFTCNSAAVARTLTRRWLPARKVNVIHNALVEGGGEFHAETSSVALEEGPRICCVSNSGAWKGLTVVLSAFRALENTAAHLYVVGADARPEYEQVLGDAARKRTHFLGERDDVPALLAKMDLFTIAPLAGESSPNVVLEAFAAGLPVVATDVGGVPELVREAENGFIVQPKDAAGLAGRLHQLLGDPALREAIGARNRERVHLFSLERKLDSLERVYRGETVVEQF